MLGVLIPDLLLTCQMSVSLHRERVCVCVCVCVCVWMLGPELPFRSRRAGPHKPWTR